MIALVTVREINQATWQSAMGKRGYVKCRELDGTERRIVRARTVKGQLQVQRLGDRQWVVPASVWWEEK